MPVRYPPGSNIPPPVNRQSRRTVRYREPEEALPIRWFRRVFTPPLIIALVFLTTIMLGVLGYYYRIFSKRIDNLLNGEVFTRSAGIYAAPGELRVGQGVSAQELIARLKRSGYVEEGQEADSSRGRYLLSNETLEIEPGQNASVDGARQFPRARVQFAKGGRGILALQNQETNSRTPTVPLEPELISSLTGRGREKRRVIGFRDLPPELVKAITVTEDRTFFEHYGINVRGILRALVRRYDADPSSPLARQGGSSITQQLVKNLLLSPERSWRRKLAEAYMSIILETRLSKQEIFALYCNEVYLGQQAGFAINGFGEAAGAYFNKDVTSLSLPESAFLAGLIRSPNRYNPYHDLGTATSRRNQVLESMLEEGAVSEQDARQAESEPLKVSGAKGRIDISEAPYFVDYAQTQLGEVLSDTSAADHLRIYTTIDMDLQRAAYAAVTKELSALDKVEAKRASPGTLQAALVAMNTQTGEVVAMVGGRDYEKSQLNRATDALRQPGSVFKPFVYATALNTACDPIPRLITPATVFTDAPKTFTFNNQEYSPGNFGEQYSNGPVTLRDALVHSLNVVTVEVAMEVTIGRVMNLAARAGLPKPQQAYPAMALGTSEATPLEIASAYTSFAAGGIRATPVVIKRVTTGRGSTIVAPRTEKKEVLRPDVSYVLTSMLKDVVDRGTAAKVRARGFKANVAGKTGTSRDGWFAGYTPNLVCVVWVGFDDGSQLGLTGADSALPIWVNFMTAALAAHPEWAGDWQMPAGIQQADIDTRTGLRAAPDDPYKRTELFTNNSAPAEASASPENENSLTPEEQEQDGGSISPEEAPAVVPSPGGAKSRNQARLELRDQPESGTRLSGTITLDIDPTTGLIAAPTCPVIRSKTFIIGQEPRAYCGPQYHTGKTILPYTTRPRMVVP